MILEGLDAIKITSFMASIQDSSYQQLTQFGRIQIMSDILCINEYKLYFNFFPKVPLLCKQYTNCINVITSTHTSQQVVKFLDKAVQIFEDLSNLMDPIKAIETRSTNMTVTKFDIPFTFTT